MFKNLEGIYLIKLMKVAKTICRNILDILKSEFVLNYYLIICKHNDKDGNLI